MKQFIRSRSRALLCSPGLFPPFLFSLYLLSLLCLQSHRHQSLPPPADSECGASGGIIGWRTSGTEESPCLHRLIKYPHLTAGHPTPRVLRGDVSPQGTMVGRRWLIRWLTNQGIRWLESSDSQRSQTLHVESDHTPSAWF